MTPLRRKSRLKDTFRVVCALIFSPTLVGAPSAWADAITVTDIAGREVTINAPVERIILGEGRQIYLLGALEPEAPFARVVGWRKDFSEADPDNYAAYAAKFPEMTRIPTFGGFKDGTFDVEQAASLEPDVVLMNLEARAATEDAAYDTKLAELGIPIVYVDFREKPLEHTIPSMRLMGRLLGDEEGRRLLSTSQTHRWPWSPTGSPLLIPNVPGFSLTAPGAIPTTAA